MIVDEKINKRFNDPETVSRILLMANALDQKYRPLNEERYRNYNMCISSLQWSAEDKKTLEEAGRPANSYNNISPIVRIISALERTNRKKLQVVGRTKDDQDTARIVNQLLDWSYDQTNYDISKSKCVVDAIIGRWGMMAQSYSYEDDPEGRLVCERINPLRIQMDMDFSDLTLKDCRYMYDNQWLTVDEILETFAINDYEMAEEIIYKNKTIYMVQDPNKKKNLVSTIWERLQGSAGYLIKGKFQEAQNPLLFNQQGTFYDSVTGRFRVIEAHERRVSRRCLLYSYLDGQTHDVTEYVVNDTEIGYDNDMLQAWREKLGGPEGLPEVRWDTKKIIWVTTVIPAFDMKIQDKPYAVQNGNFVYTPIFAYDLHPDIMQSQSIVDELIDPQSSYNKRRSTILEIITRFASLGYTQEEGATAGYEEEWENRSIGSMKTINKQYWGKVQPDQMPSIPPAIFQYENEDRQAMNDISGVRPENMGGQQESGQSGILFNSKVQQGELMLQYLFDNVEQANKTIGRNSLDLIQKYMTEERMIRITEDLGDPQWIVINQRTIDGIKNDITKGKFDLVVSSQPYGRTAREMEYMRLLDMVKFTINAFPQAAPYLMPVLAQASDTPYRSDFIKALEQANGEADRAKQQAIQMQAIDQQKAQLQAEQQKQAIIGQAAATHQQLNPQPAGQMIEQGAT